MKPRHHIFISFAMVGSLFCNAASAIADGPVKLTTRQLDRVTAGGGIVGSSTDAFATGAVTITNTTSNSFLTSGQPYKGQPGLTNTSGAADGTALAVGTNLGLTGEPPPSSGTSVNTAGEASGNTVLNSTYNHTTVGAGGVVFQVGWTFVYGGWTGL